MPMTALVDPATLAPVEADTAARHYALVARAIEHLRSHAAEQPDLAALAHAVHLSPHHLQRVFAQWVGISPKRFLQYQSKS